MHVVQEECNNFGYLNAMEDINEMKSSHRNYDVEDYTDNNYCPEEEVSVDDTYYSKETLIMSKNLSQPTMFPQLLDSLDQFSEDGSACSSLMIKASYLEKNADRNLPIKEKSEPPKIWMNFYAPASCPRLNVSGTDSHSVDSESAASSQMVRKKSEDQTSLMSKIFTRSLEKADIKARLRQEVMRGDPTAPCPRLSISTRDTIHEDISAASSSQVSKNSDGDKSANKQSQNELLSSLTQRGLGRMMWQKNYSAASCPRLNVYHEETHEDESAASSHETKSSEEDNLLSLNKILSKSLEGINLEESARPELAVKSTVDRRMHWKNNYSTLSCPRFNLAHNSAIFEEDSDASSSQMTGRSDGDTTLTDSAATKSIDQYERPNENKPSAISVKPKIDRIMWQNNYSALSCPRLNLSKVDEHNTEQPLIHTNAQVDEDLKSKLSSQNKDTSSHESSYIAPERYDSDTEISEDVSRSLTEVDTEASGSDFEIKTQPKSGKRDLGPTGNWMNNYSSKSCPRLLPSENKKSNRLSPQRRRTQNENLADQNRVEVNAKGNDLQQLLSKVSSVSSKKDSQQRSNRHSLLIQSTTGKSMWRLANGLIEPKKDRVRRRRTSNMV